MRQGTQLCLQSTHPILALGTPGRTMEDKVFTGLLGLVATEGALSVLHGAKASHIDR